MSGTKKCPFCAEDIKVEALKCRFCGSALDGSTSTPLARAVQMPPPAQPIQVKVQPQSGIFMRTIKNLVALLSFVVLASVVGTCVVCGKAAHDVAEKHEQRNEVEQQAVQTESAIEVSAAELERAYKANEVSADSQYKGKVLRVSGTVARISKDILDDPQVTLRSNDILGGVICSFGSSGAADVAQLSKGARVILKGIGDGYMMGSPMLRRCVVDGAMGPACRVPNAEDYGGRTVTGECKDISGCGSYYEGFCKGGKSIVCCVDGVK